MRMRFMNRGDGSYLAVFDRVDTHDMEHLGDIQAVKDEVSNETGVYGVLFFGFDLEIDEGVR